MSFLYAYRIAYCIIAKYVCLQYCILTCRFVCLQASTLAEFDTCRIPYFQKCSLAELLIYGNAYFQNWIHKIAYFQNCIPSELLACFVYNCHFAGFQNCIYVCILCIHSCKIDYLQNCLLAELQTCIKEYTCRIVWLQNFAKNTYFQNCLFASCIIAYLQDFRIAYLYTYILICMLAFCHSCNGWGYVSGQPWTDLVFLV